MAFRKISLKRTSNNLACALQCFSCLFLCTFCAAKNRSFKPKLNQKKVLKLSHFCKKRKNFFAFFFWDPRLKSQILAPYPSPPFENFSLNILNSEEKPSVKKSVDRAGQKPVDQPVNRQWFWNFTGRVEKILTGSTSVMNQRYHWKNTALPLRYTVIHHSYAAKTNRF